MGVEDQLTSGQLKMMSPCVSRSMGPAFSYQRSLMVVVSEATVVDDDVRTPERKRARIQRDFIGKEDVLLVRKGDDTTKTFGIIVLLRVSRQG